MSYNFSSLRWWCSSCGVPNQTDRNIEPCRRCHLLDSDKRRATAKALYLFGIIPTADTHLISPATPFFIYPLISPTIRCKYEENAYATTLQFHVRLTDITGTAAYDVTKIRVTFKQSSCPRYQRTSHELLREGHQNRFIFRCINELDHYPLRGEHILCITACVRFPLLNWNEHEQRHQVSIRFYKEYAPACHLRLALKGQPPQKWTHQKALKDFIVNDSNRNNAGFVLHGMSTNPSLQQNVSSDDDQKVPENYNKLQLIQLSKTNDEYSSVFAKFLDSAKMEYEDLKEIFIYKIHHEGRKDAFEKTREIILRKLGNDRSKLNELTLYHGTPLQVIPDILHQGFLRQFTERAMYGKGSYYAKRASYSCHRGFAQPDADKFQHILMCQVVCGEWTLGKIDMKKPPTKKDQGYDHIAYESTVDRMNNPSIFVTFSDDQALATYLISFKNDNDKKQQK